MRQKSTKFVGTLLAAGMIFSFAGMTVLSEAKAKGKITANDVLNDRELNGLALFDGKANCAACHPSTPSDDQSAPGLYLLISAMIISIATGGVWQDNV